MKVCFSLSMPNVGSWNGKWSGAGTCYAVVENVTSQKQIEKYKPILDRGYFYYNFGDGWGAGITVKEVTAKEATALKKASRGFCGYEWMIASIKKHGDIRID